MSNPIDKFFKDKLAEHTLEPGVNAWAKVSSGLTKKNRSIIWFRAAAAVMMVGMASLLWFYSNTTSTEPTVITKSEEVQPIPEEQNQPPKEKIEVPLQNTVPNKPSHKIEIAEQKEKVKSNERALTAKVIPDKISTQREEVLIAEINIPEIDIPAETTNAEQTKAIVIVYELKAIPKRTTSEFEIGSLPEKKTGLKKVLEIAQDVRTGDSPLGGLRQAKEEILAFNFKKEVKNNK